MVVQPPKIVPPIHLAQVNELPKFKGSVNGDLLLYIQNLKEIIQKQNINTQAIRLWMQTLKQK